MNAIRHPAPTPGSYLVLIGGISGFSAKADAAILCYNDSGAVSCSLRTRIS